MTATVTFGDIDKFILFGGGAILYKLSLELLGQGKNVLVISSKRHTCVTIENGCSLEQLLEKGKVRYIVPDTLKEEAVTKEITDKTLGLSLGAAWIFNREFIGALGGRLVNSHETRLPRNRGGGAYSWGILMADTVGADSLHLVDEGVDTGDIIKYREYVYPSFCRRPIDYMHFAFESTYQFLKEFLNEVLAGKEFKRTQQQETFSSYFPRLNTDIHGYIDWNWRVVDLERFVCAFDEPYNGARSFLNEKHVRLRDCRANWNDGSFHPFQAGIVYRKSESGVYVAALDGGLIFGKITDDSGNSVVEKIRVGDRFHTPASYLEKAKTYRAVYLPSGIKETAT